jgi:hypothetical protein
MRPFIYSADPDATMTVKKDQDTRAKFYTTPSLAKYLALNGVPKSRIAFRAMVASGSTADPASKEGLSLNECLGQVTFSVHPQQINIMDKTNGRTIASITR